MGRTIFLIAFLLVAVIAERVGVALSFWTHQERDNGQHYAIGRVLGWRGVSKPTLYLHFRVPPTSDPMHYEVKAPGGLLSTWFLSSASGWGLYHRIRPVKYAMVKYEYLLQVETRTWLVLGAWGVRNALWLELRPDARAGSASKLPSQNQEGTASLSFCTENR